MRRKMIHVEFEFEEADPRVDAPVRENMSKGTLFSARGPGAIGIGGLPTGRGPGLTLTRLKTQAVDVSAKEAKEFHSAGTKAEPGNSKMRYRALIDEMEMDLMTPAALGGGADEALRQAKADGFQWGIDALGLKERQDGGAGVKVALLDTGLDIGHDAFRGIAFNKENCRNFAGGRKGDVADTDGHGTHCAGIIFGRTVDGVRIGVAPGITDVYVAKVFNKERKCSTEGLLKALNWACLEKKVDIVSLSLSLNFENLRKQFVKEGYREEISFAWAALAFQNNMRAFRDLFDNMSRSAGYGAGSKKGTLFVAAAGNDSRRDVAPNFYAPCSLPAAVYDGVISVGAVARTERPGRYRTADFSNGLVKLCAPGVDIVSAQAGGRLGVQSGTSMACPHVVGLAALHWQDTPAPVEASVVSTKLTGQARQKVFDPAYSLEEHGSGLPRPPVAD